MKGADPLIIAIILIVITVTTATVISGWSSTVLSRQTAEIENQTSTKLSCQVSSFYVSNVTINCNNNCFTGYPYRINATIENTGSEVLDFSNLFITLTDGTSYVIHGSRTIIAEGGILEKVFEAMQIFGSPKIPIETMDLRNAYSNDSNSIGLWHFDDAAGNETADSALNNTGRVYAGLKGILTNSPTWNTSGYYGNALSFDGIDDYVDTGKSTVIGSLVNDITVTAWINVNVTTGIRQRIISSSRENSANGIGFAVEDDGGLRFTTYGVKDYDSTTITLSNYTWYHVAAVMDSSNDVTFYVDGIERETVTHTTAGNVNTDDVFYIGSNTLSGSSTLLAQFIGTIDEVTIWNRSLNGAEINSTMNSANPNNLSFENDMVGYWPFSEGSGSEANSEHFWAPGKFSRSIKFNGASEYVKVSPADFSNDTATFEAWINMSRNSVNDNYTIFSVPTEISNNNTGLAAKWHFEQNSTTDGDVRDSSSFGNNGTAVGSPVFNSSGKSNNAWSFEGDGVGSFIEVNNADSLNVSDEITITAWIKPRENAFSQARYVASDYQDDYNVEVISYVDGNTITYGSNAIKLDSGEIATISSSDISFGTVINGTGPFEATFDSSAVDMPVPERFAGKEFVYDSVRSTQNLSFCAPYEDANLTFYGDDKTLVGTLNMTVGSCNTFEYAFTNFWFYVNSTGLVVGQMVQSNIDGRVLYPAADDLWGIDDEGSYGVGKDNTDVTFYTSDGTLNTATRNFGVQVGITGSSIQGFDNAVHIIANETSVGAVQLADGDGSEASTYYPRKELSHVFALPMNAQYISFATTEPNTTCSMLYANGTVATYTNSTSDTVNKSTSGTNIYPYPNNVYIGDSNINPTEFIDKGIFFVCDALSYAYYEEDGANDESNMWGLKDPGIIFKPGSYGLAFSPPGNVNGYINSKGISSGSITLDTWHHVALTYNSTQMKLYIDGVLNVSTNMTGEILQGRSNLTIGRYGNEHFNGTIDEVAIYNYTLSAAEIRDVYLGSLSLYKDGDELRFDVGNASLAYNVSAWTDWHHVAGAYNSTHAFLYADGTRAASQSNLNLVKLGSDVYIGGIVNDADNLTFNGTIDEVRISNYSRSFNTTISINVSSPDIKFVRLHNSTGLVNQSADQSAASAYYTEYENLKTYNDFRVEVEDIYGTVIESWHPFETGGSCVDTGLIERIRFSSLSCPSITDSYFPEDINFESCG